MDGTRARNLHGIVQIARPAEVRGVNGPHGWPMVDAFAAVAWRVQSLVALHTRAREALRLEIRMLLIVLLVVLVLSIGGGGWGHSRYGYAGWSPAGLVLVVLALLYFTGHL